MRPTKPLSITLAAIAILALAALALVWIGSRTGFARRWAGELLAEAVGLPVTVGEFRIGLLPRLELHLGDVSVAQPEGFGADPLVELGQASVVLRWSGLFGAMSVHSVSVDEPLIRLAIANDGRNNWSDVIERITAGEDKDPAAWSLNQLAVEKGALEFRDQAAATEARLTAVTIAASDVAPGHEFPLELRLAAVAGTGTYHFGATGRGRLDPDAGRYLAKDISMRGWAGGEPLPIAGVELEGLLALASWDSAAGKALVEGGRFKIAGVSGRFQGVAIFAEPEMQLEFSVDTDSFAPRPAAVAFGRPLPETADPKAYGQAQLSLRGGLSQDGFQIDPMQGRLDDTRFTGRAVPSQRLVRLHADRVVVDRYLAPAEKTRREKRATLEAAIDNLGTFDVDAEIRIDEARVAGATLRDAVVRVERSAEAGR